MTLGRRTLGYGLLFVLSPVAAAALLAIVIGRWSQYQTYRDTGAYPAAPRLRLFYAYVLLLVGVIAVEPRALVDHPEALVLLVYLTVRARFPLRRLLRAARSGRRTLAG
jgi:hypothetical protein